jgi:hypothetical protein
MNWSSISRMEVLCPGERRLRRPSQNENLRAWPKAPTQATQLRRSPGATGCVAIEARPRGGFPETGKQTSREGCVRLYWVHWAFIATLSLPLIKLTG